MAALIEFQLPILVVAIPMPAQGQQRHKLLPLPAAKGTSCANRRHRVALSDQQIELVALVTEHHTVLLPPTSGSRDRPQSIVTDVIKCSTMQLVKLTGYHVTQFSRTWQNSVYTDAHGEC